ncbi:MAG: di-trans,poly-cis-decaprenylcistransferase [Simkaniaceae bacterium]|nr:di-trans,poly-cis-decaprenylcistransferase [Simkaniaceae bacterium]
MNLSASLLSFECVIFTQEELKDLVLNEVPKHIAIIMDGNRRWARLRNKPAIYGHYQGAHAFDRTITAAVDLGVKIITSYSFSTENWRRSSLEVSGLMRLLNYYLVSKTEKMKAKGIRFHTIGDLSPLPPQLKMQIQTTKEVTQFGTKLDLILAINYGARDDIRRAAMEAVKHCREGELTEVELGKYLDTAAWPDPELFIRTGGEKRLSNFLLWQLSYAELYFTEVMWPEFSPKDFLKAIQTYQARTRRWGK